MNNEIIIFERNQWIVKMTPDNHMAKIYKRGVKCAWNCVPREVRRVGVSGVEYSDAGQDAVDMVNESCDGRVDAYGIPKK